MKNVIDQVDRRFCVITFQGKDLPCIVPDGYFANTAFHQGLTKNSVYGEKFAIISGDDFSRYCIDKHRVREVNASTMVTLCRQDHVDQLFSNEVARLLAEESPLQARANW